MTAPRPSIASVEALWRGLHDRLLAFVARRTSSQQDAEDVVQDVFLRMHLALQSGPPVDKLDAWMFRIARNALVDRYRRANARPQPLSDEPDEPDEVDALRSALAECLTPFVDKLPAPYADAVRWVDLEGLTQAEAAARAGLSLSGMKSRVQRGRARLRELLGVCCQFELDCRGKVVGYEAKTRCCDA